ncbi:polysaccharide deacetylase family protein [Sphingomonas sp. CARO-RG-8B-R24-01]|uniref:polysaccharide deacetylase family protein n=1 Tax=Sphingomonas sp. CARO-RG-8B-R24-01 TaxID=2914831 RepID=UPI001F56A733|nr:polysaccharide deacetylase family protein [Sphingomonas sp. CARO-RG-8B-R24-01]
MLTTLTLVGFASLAVPVYAEGPTPPKAGRVVAITFDDLPYANDGSTVSPDAAIAAQRNIVSALRRARVPATGFVNEDKVKALGPVGPRLLADWNKSLLALGNHGYSHFDSNNLDVAGIEKEVVKGEATIRPLAASRDRSIPFFRFPYNHVGDTEAKRLTIEKLLASHGYKLAASTIDTSDYLFNSAYERAFAKRNKTMMQRVERAYLDHTRVQITYYGELDRKVLGREVPAIMLLHANRLNAATIEPLLGLFRLAGYGFVSLGQAQADPAYSAMPAVATKFGPMWGYRWARERQVKIDGRLEQEPPAWISEYASQTS